VPDVFSYLFELLESLSLLFFKCQFIVENDRFHQKFGVMLFVRFFVYNCLHF